MSVLLFRSAFEVGPESGDTALIDLQNNEGIKLRFLKVSHSERGDCAEIPRP
jgi:hypothetical protein